MASLTVRRGDDEVIRGAVTDRDTLLPLDITAWLIQFTVKRRWPDTAAAAVLTKTTAASTITITDGPGGRFAVSIYAADFAGMPNAERTVLLYDVQVTYAGPAVKTLGQGEFIVLGDITTA